MKNKFRSLLVVITVLIAITSCTKDKVEDSTNTETSNKKIIQFYIDPARYQQTGTGLVVTSITINGKNYIPKTSIGNCSDSYTFQVTANSDGSEYMQYKINIRNYNSLEVIMLGVPFTAENYQGVIYANEIKSGCNLLEVVAGNGVQLHVLKVRG